MKKIIWSAILIAIAFLCIATTSSAQGQGCATEAVFASFTGNLSATTTGEVNLVWQVSTFMSTPEQGHIQVERWSYTLNRYIPLGTIIPFKKGQQMGFVDKTPQSGVNLYRLICWYQSQIIEVSAVRYVQSP